MQFAIAFRQPAERGSDSGSGFTAGEAGAGAAAPGAQPIGQLADRFVGMYVNERTLDYGPDGREAVRRLLDMGHKAGIIPQTPRVEWV